MENWRKKNMFVEVKYVFMRLYEVVVSVLDWCVSTMTSAESEAQAARAVHRGKLALSSRVQKTLS